MSECLLRRDYMARLDRPRLVGGATDASVGVPESSKKSSAIDGFTKYSTVQ